jgi:predicted Holliday junction resolvase-like endonuclease
MLNRWYDFYKISRRILGVCPCCQEFIRLSDCHISARAERRRDWLDALLTKENRLTCREERLDERESDLRDAAHDRGECRADRAARKFDRVLRPRRLNPKDAKVLCHPVEFLVFAGLGRGAVSRVILLDREPSSESRQRLHDSIRDSIDRRRIEWETLRITESGGIAKDTGRRRRVAGSEASNGTTAATV